MKCNWFVTLFGETQKISLKNIVKYLLLETYKFKIKKKN